jgi:ABC-type xylose transport system substrate-binding protein
MKALKPFVDKGDVKIVFDQYLSEWTSMEAYMKATDFLSTYNGKIDGIIAANDGLAEGIMEAVSIFRPDETIPITGQDATVAAYHNILNNQQGMTIYKPIDSLATKAAELACALAEKKPVKIENAAVAYNGLINVPFIKMEPVTISKENIESLLSSSNYLREEYLKQRK